MLQPFSARSLYAPCLQRAEQICKPEAVCLHDAYTCGTLSLAMVLLWASHEQVYDGHALNIAAPNLAATHLAALALTGASITHTCVGVLCKL